MPYRLDRNKNGGGLLLYVREDISSKILHYDNNFESFFVELNFKKQKWLLSCSYNPHYQTIGTHLNNLQTHLDMFSSKYERVLFIGDFNCEVSDIALSSFCDDNKLKSLIKSPTCYKNPVNPKCIDLMLTNFPKSFINCCTLETGLSDFHKMTLSVLKITYNKLIPKIIKYRDFIRFS